jgi:hypothetical protein
MFALSDHASTFLSTEHWSKVVMQANAGALSGLLERAFIHHAAVDVL